MKNVNALLIRYFGSDANRHHVLQRASGKFWTGDSWCAKIIESSTPFIQLRHFAPSIAR
jgi:hypothetical protein